jgi:hypothetical protein
MTTDELSSQERGQAAVCGYLLGLRTSLLVIARACAALSGALIWHDAEVSNSLGLLHKGSAVLVVLLAVGAEWLNGRLQLDQNLFAAMSRAEIHPTDLDALLCREPRDLLDRGAGAIGVLRRLALCSAGQVVLAIGLIWK